MKIQIDLTFLALAYPGCPGNSQLNGCLSVKLKKNITVFLDSYIGSRPSDHYFRSDCLFVCVVFLSRLRSDFDQTRTYVICLGLVVSPRI